MGDQNGIPPTLRDVQARLFGLVTRRGQVGGQGLVRSDDRLDAAGRVQLYANMYFLRLRDILRADYPKLAAVLGDDSFDGLVADYLDAFPSRHPSVRHAGGALPGFVDAHALGRRRRWLAELARLEWARVEVHDRVDEELLAWSDVRGQAPGDLGQLRLRLIQAHTLVNVDHAVTDVWSRVQHGKRPRRPGRRPGCILVWRQDGLVYHRMPPSDESALLPCLVSGTSFASVCDRLDAGGAPEHAASRAAELLATWTAAGLLAGSW
jgi:Putative DNA-binding domain